MLTLIMSINLTTTILFMLMNHPLSMGLTLMIQTILVSLLTGSMNENLWFSYILFLIMIGGMLILFMYMTSIASNEKFKTNPMIIILITIIIPTYLLINTNYKTNTTNNLSTPSENIINTNLSFSKFINIPLNILLIFTMIYLLLTLIATVKITNFSKGPIRQMN